MRNKTLLTAFALGLLGSGVACHQALAIPLLPGSAVTPTVSSLGGGASLVASLTGVAFTTPGSASVTGTIDSWVYNNDANNTYGGLTFVYQVHVSSGSAVEHVTFNDYSFNLVDVGYGVGGVSPSTADRGSFGTPVEFNWQRPNVITAGSSSGLLFIHTDALTYAPQLDGVIDGATVNVNLLGPAVPDGGLTIALLGFVMVGVEGLRRRLGK